MLSYIITHSGKNVSFDTQLVLGMLVDIQIKLWCTIVRIL